MTRFAIYFVPDPCQPVWTYGCRAIGYDSRTGEDMPFHTAAFFGKPDVEAWTADPRRYGFHATLKPPFTLAEGASVPEIECALETFAAARPAVDLGHLEVTTIGRFLALTPREPVAAANALAAGCVRAFEVFRAPLSEADRARRLHTKLSERQVAYLDQWGYPFVFEEFRFHMTLTGSLPDAAAVEDGREALTALYAPVDLPVRIDALALCEQPARDRRFRVRRTFKLGRKSG